MSGIVALQDELGMKFSYEQIEAISQGLRDPTWEQAAVDWMHPLVRKRNVLRIVYGVREYLVKGPADPALRAEALKELRQWADERRDILTARYDEEADIIAEAEADVLASIADHCRNPLRCTYVLPVGEEMLAEAEKNWEKLVSRFEASPEPVFLDRNRKRQFETLFLRGLSPLLNSPASYEPQPAELAAAEADIHDHLPEVSEWHSRERRRKRAERELEEETSVLLDEALDGAETTLTLPTPPAADSPPSADSGVPSGATGQEQPDGPVGHTGLPLMSQQADDRRVERGTRTHAATAQGDGGLKEPPQGHRMATVSIVRLAGLIAVGCILGVTLLYLRRRRQDIGDTGSD